MDKAKIIKILTSKIHTKSREPLLLNDIEQARKDLEYARMYFDLVKEPKLVDYAIYTEEAAKVTDVYLLLKAKEENIKLEDYSILNI